MVEVNTVDIEGGVPIGPVRRWWALAIRGVLAIAFGVLAFAQPVSSLLAIVVVFGAYALAEGVFTVVAGIRHRRETQHWGWLVFEGIVGITAGILTFAWPGISALALLYVIAAWAIVTGIAEIFAAMRLRKQIENEWMLVLSGVLSIALGLLMFALPGAAAVVVVYWIAAYAVVFGILQVALAFRLRRFAHVVRRDIGPGMPHPV